MPQGTCKFCGCTETSPCVSTDGDTCAWINNQTQDVCSACLLRAIDAGPDAADSLGFANYVHLLGVAQIGLFTEVRQIHMAIGRLVMMNVEAHREAGKLWTPGMGS
jgi:hypothetical protein